MQGGGTVFALSPDISFGADLIWPDLFYTVDKEPVEELVRIILTIFQSFSLLLSLVLSQITVFRMGSEGHQDIDLAILTALLKGGFVAECIPLTVPVYIPMYFTTSILLLLQFIVQKFFPFLSQLN